MPEKDPATCNSLLIVNQYGILCYPCRYRGDLPVHCLADRLHRPDQQFFYASTFVVDRETPPF